MIISLILINNYDNVYSFWEVALISKLKGNCLTIWMEIV